MSVGCKKTELIASKRTQFTLLGRNGPEANVRFGSLATCAVHQAMSAKGQYRTCAIHQLSINSSARSSTGGGIVRPSALAVFKLIMSSNLVGCSTGISPGFE